MTSGDVYRLSIRMPRRMRTTSVLRSGSWAGLMILLLLGCGCSSEPTAAVDGDPAGAHWVGTWSSAQQAPLPVL